MLAILTLDLLASACGGSRSPTAPAESPWSPPVFVVDSVFNPQLAVDGGGNMLLVWEYGPNDSRTYFGQSVWAKRFVPGSGWGSSETLWDLGHLGPLGSLDPRVAVSPSGGAIVAWSVRDVTGAVWVDVFDPSSGWSAPLRLVEAAYCGNRLVIPQTPVVAADGAEGGFVVFTKDGCCTQPTSPTTCAAGATAYETYASRWSLKDGFSPPQSVLPHPQARGGALVAADAAGNAFVARVLYPEIHNQSSAAVLAVARFDAKRGWLPPDDLPVPDLAGLWALATDRAGNAHVLWTRYDSVSQSSASYTLWAASLGPSIGWASPQRIGSSHLSIVGDVTAAWDQNGGAAAVWAQLSPAGIWASRLDSSGMWETPQALQDDASARCPAVVADGSGGLVAAWQQTDAEASSMWAARFSQPQGWDRPVLVARALVASAWSLGCPMLAATPDGDSLLFWQQISTAWPPGLRPATGDRAVYMSRLEVP